MWVAPSGGTSDYRRHKEKFAICPVVFILAGKFICFSLNPTALSFRWGLKSRDSSGVTQAFDNILGVFKHPTLRTEQLWDSCPLYGENHQFFFDQPAFIISQFSKSHLFSKSLSVLFTRETNSGIILGDKIPREEIKLKQNAYYKSQFNKTVSRRSVSTHRGKGNIKTVGDRQERSQRKFTLRTPALGRQAPWQWESTLLWLTVFQFVIVPRKAHTGSICVCSE